MVEITRNLWRRKLRTVLTISGILMGILALTTMGAMSQNFNALMDGGVTYYGSHIGVVDNKSGGGAFGGGILPVAKVAEIERVQGVAAAFPATMIAAKPGALTVVSFGMPDYIATTNPAQDNYETFKVTFAHGHNISASSQGDVVLGDGIAKEFSKNVGDTIDLPIRTADAPPGLITHRFTVVGIYNRTQTAPDSGAFVSLADIQQLLIESMPATVAKSLDASQITSSIIVYGSRGVNLDSLAEKINANVSGVLATKPSKLVSSFKSSEAAFNSIILGAALLAVIIGGLAIINTMIMNVTERYREIGLKKAVGARTHHIITEIVAEAALIGFIGGVAGFGLGWLLTVFLNSQGTAGTQMFMVTPALAAVALAFAVVLGALAGLIPAVRAARLDPVTALRSL